MAAKERKEELKKHETETEDKERKKPTGRTKNSLDSAGSQEKTEKTCATAQTSDTPLEPTPNPTYTNINIFLADWKGNVRIVTTILCYLFIVWEFGPEYYENVLSRVTFKMYRFWAKIPSDKGKKAYIRRICVTAAYDENRGLRRIRNIDIPAEAEDMEPSEEQTLKKTLEGLSHQNDQMSVEAKIDIWSTLNSYSEKWPAGVQTLTNQVRDGWPVERIAKKLKVSKDRCRREADKVKTAICAKHPELKEYLASAWYRVSED